MKRRLNINEEIEIGVVILGETSSLDRKQIKALLGMRKLPRVPAVKQQELDAKDLLEVASADPVDSDEPNAAGVLEP